MSMSYYDLKQSMSLLWYDTPTTQLQLNRPIYYALPTSSGRKKKNNLSSLSLQKCRPSDVKTWIFRVPGG